MYRKVYPGIFLLVGLLIGFAASGRIILRAQDRAHPAPLDPGPRDLQVGKPVEDAGPARPAVGAGSASVQDVLLRPYRFPFSRPTSLAQVCLHLKQTLGVAVVLDVAAMDRQNVEADDTVQLELDGVRLKTGLKLLLDQVRLTYHVVPEDNLLLITDRQGSEDPIDRLWNEMRAVHREMHDVQDAIDELTDALYADEPEEGARLRKPTIIEEKPDDNAAAPEAPPGDARPPKARTPRPGAVEPPDHPRGTRSSPSRIPLGQRRGAARVALDRPR